MSSIFMRKIFMAVVILFSAPAFALIEPETEGMEAVSRDDGTFLVGGPTFVFDRISGAGGIHSESELWSSEKIRNRILFNRLSVTPSWEPYKPSMWLRTGNELGDMIYQDPLYVNEDRPSNRTPLLEAGFRTPLLMGFWFTARLFQVDHYSDANMKIRKKQVADEFAWFGENWPLFSTAYGGFGYTVSGLDAMMIVGDEYIWVYSESSRWIPIHYSPRVEARADWNNLSLSLVYENAEYQNAQKKESGTRTEVNGSIDYKCDALCKNNMFWFGVGMQFRKVNDDGVVYTELEDDILVWPFVQLKVNPVQGVLLDATIGVNNRDWLLQDSIEWKFDIGNGFGFILGEKNIAGTRMNPVADTKEFFDADTIDLVADGVMQLHELYVNAEDTLNVFRIGVRSSGWAEYGAETFDVKNYVKDNGFTYRIGDVSRIDEWIYGFTGKLWVSLDYGKMFTFTSLGGFEHIWGPSRKFEISPVEYFAAFEGDWLLNGLFKISHSIRYRSDARWNLRSSKSMVVKGDWYWDATFEQRFPKQGFYLSGTLLHVLSDEVIQVPNGSFDRLRFICTLKKTF